MKLRVMRTWAFLDRGALDGTVRNTHEPGHKSGVYFQYWDPRLGRAARHDGPDGLARLDFLLHHSRRLGLKLILVLTNSWRDFGGMDQYLAWYGLAEHQDFFTDVRVRNAYKDWAAALVQRRNSIDGTLYSEDPAIFAWELANEPRAFIDPASEKPVDSSVITRWADDMSRYIKTMDTNHMVSVGDEGFFTNGPSSSWPYRSSFGVDHEALTGLAAVDFGTYHLYPEIWGTAEGDFGVRWIQDHIEMARRLGKPTVLEEYGVRVARKPQKFGEVMNWEKRRTAYGQWNEAVFAGGGAGSLFWMLSVTEEKRALFPDFDGLAVYRDDETALLLERFAERMSNEAPACEGGPKVSEQPASPFVRAWPAVDAPVRERPVLSRGKSAPGGQ